MGYNLWNHWWMPVNVNDWKHKQMKEKEKLLNHTEFQLISIEGMAGR